jgi:alkanesulfonate monooxygenase SsuD/methylene tetrahydromethanopterin reductase-like flavin-dependent oxidoreductase (luciferase family)
VDRYVNDVVIHGSPAEVVDKIVALRAEIGLDYLMCAPLSHETFMLFTDHVLPKLA